jgi:hypothetical protein
LPTPGFNPIIARQRRIRYRNFRKVLFNNEKRESLPASKAMVPAGRRRENKMIP